MGNIKIVNIDDELEKQEFENNNSLRSPRFHAHLLDKSGEKRCVLCNCGISEIIQGAHIWPVADIKRVTTLSDQEKLAYATDGENGLRIGQNHHKLFDSNILFLSPSGKVSYRVDLSKEDEEYIDSITTVSNLSPKLVTSKYAKYIKKRYELV